LVLENTLLFCVAGWGEYVRSLDKSDIFCFPN
jgi:hypothetical protein